MAIEVEVKGGEQLARLFFSAPLRMRQGIALALKIATRDIRGEAIRGKEFRTRTGALERSVSQRVDEQRLEGEVYLDPKIARYGKWVHDGWERKKPIIPLAPRRALHFVVNGQNIFASKVTKPAKFAGDQFLTRAFEKKLPAVTELLAQAGARAILSEKGVK